MSAYTWEFNTMYIHSLAQGFVENVLVRTRRIMTVSIAVILTSHLSMSIFNVLNYPVHVYLVGLYNFME